jgi:hypothetical protein
MESSEPVKFLPRTVKRCACVVVGLKKIAAFTANVILFGFFVLMCVRDKESLSSTNLPFYISAANSS